MSSDAFANVPLFRDLPRKSLERIEKTARHRSFRSGDVIFREGEEGVGFFLITSGKVEVTRSGQHIASIGEGGFFGEMALLDNHRRSATVQAADDTESMAIMRSDFLAELRGNADLAVELLGLMSRRVRELDERLSAS